MIAMMLINLSPHMRAELLNVCDLLSGTITPAYYGFKDEDQFKKFHQRSRKILNVAYYFGIYSSSFVVISGLVLAYLRLNLLHFLLYDLTWFIFNLYVSIHIITTSTLISGFLLINCLGLRPRLNKIITRFDQVLTRKCFKTSGFIGQLLMQLDLFYREVAHKNRYWSYFLCSIYFSMILSTLLTCDLVFFEDINRIGRTAYTFGFILCFFSLSVNFQSALFVSNQQLVLYKRLNSIMVRLRMPIQLKYKLMLTIERLGCGDYPHQMGLTCHKLFTIDRLVIKDSLLYCLGLFLLIRGVSVSLSVKN